MNITGSYYDKFTCSCDTGPDNERIIFKTIVLHYLNAKENDCIYLEYADSSLEKTKYVCSYDNNNHVYFSDAVKYMFCRTCHFLIGNKGSHMVNGNPPKDK